MILPWVLMDLTTPLERPVRGVRRPLLSTATKPLLGKFCGGQCDMTFHPSLFLGPVVGATMRANPQGSTSEMPRGWSGTSPSLTPAGGPPSSACPARSVGHCLIAGEVTQRRFCWHRTGVTTQTHAIALWVDGLTTRDPRRLHALIC